jgi:hypothetical protein
VHTLSARDTSSGTRLGCDGGSAPDGSPALTLDLPAGNYYAVLKGQTPVSGGDYRLTVGGAAPATATFAPPSYDETVTALGAAGIRVASVLSCDGLPDCGDATGQATLLAADTAGVARSASSAADVPSEIVRAVETLESLDRVVAQLEFSPDANPGFTDVRVEPIFDADDGCTLAADMSGLLDCRPGARPAFRVSLLNPASAPVPPSGAADGAYQFTLRVRGERDGRARDLQVVPIFVVPTGSAPPGSYGSGAYFQDFDSRGCDDDSDQRPSWDVLRFDADVRPDTRVHFFACTADTAAALDDCATGGPDASGLVRVLTVSAGSGSGRPCSAETQASDCPGGYCSPYTGLCNALEGAACEVDADCPGSAEGRCHEGPSAAELGRTCRVEDVTGVPSSALDADNLRPFMRMQVELESLGTRARTPSVFFWEAWYRCRNVE